MAMRRSMRFGIAAWAIALLTAISHPSASSSSQVAPSSSQSAAASPHASLVNQYCVTCHNERLKTGGLTLDSVSLTDVPRHADVWEKVIRKVRAGMMPPPGMPRPPQQALDGLVAHLESTID